MGSNGAVIGLQLYKKVRQFLSSESTRTYILPTLFGVAFGIMSLVLFFLSVGYSNNLMYAFFFFLISVALTSAVFTNRNIDRLHLRILEDTTVFAQEVSRVPLKIRNDGKRAAWEIEIAVVSTELNSKISKIEPLSEVKSEIQWVPPRRGVQRLPKIILQSYFPFGLLRAWRAYSTNLELLVYPLRSGDSRFPKESDSAVGKNSTGLFRDHRIYQSTDSMRRIDWRASARRQELLVKNLEENNKAPLVFKWEFTTHLGDFEQRISQLCLWVDEAERRGHQYALSVGDSLVEMDNGIAHWKKCMRVLSLLQPADVS